MSYRNPKIIDDKSGLIVSQAIDKATATLGQGIVAFGAEEKRREEVRKKEQERRDKIYIGLANDMAKDSTLFNEGISKGSTELRNTLIPRNEMLLKRINDIQIQQQINGNRDPELSKELSNLRIQISDGNNFAESFMETAALLTKTMEDPQAFVLGEKTFTMIDGSQDESETIFNAIGGNPNYTRSFTSDLSVIVTNKTTGQSFKNTREQFEAKAKNLYITKKTNTSVLQTKIMNDKIYNKDGSISHFLLDGQGGATMGQEPDGTGYVARYKTQPLNDAAVNNIKNALLDDTFAFVESFVSKQEQGLYLKDIGITGENLKDYQNADSESRKRLLKGSRDLIFNKNSGITQDIKGNYVIKKQIGNSTKVKGPNAAQIREAEWSKVTTQNFNPFDDNGVRVAGQSLAEAIINSLPQNRINAGEDGEIKVEANSDGNIVVYTGKIDKDKTQKASDKLFADLFNNKNSAAVTGKAPDLVYETQIYDITTGTNAERISRLSKYFMTSQKVGYATAEAKAREFLNAPLK